MKITNGKEHNGQTRETLRRFFERNPHPPWMNDDRYFRNSGFGDEADADRGSGLHTQYSDR